MTRREVDRVLLRIRSTTQLIEDHAERVDDWALVSLREASAALDSVARVVLEGDES